jgi:hypothetical protein
VCVFFTTAEAANSRPLTESGSESESDSEVGAQAPPLTKQISNILSRYPEGGQILKVLLQLMVEKFWPLRKIKTHLIFNIISAGISQGPSLSVGVSGC